MQKQSHHSVSTKVGFSLVELLIAVVVLAILTGLVLNSGSAAQRKARITTAMTALENYNSAFSTVVLNHPGIMMDREDAWGDDGSSYTTSVAMARLVSSMNELLDNNLKLVPSGAEGGAYRSTATDPWGGYYVLMEYPFPEGNEDGYDPTTGAGKSAMRCSIWATGIDEGVIVDKKVSKNSVGCGLIYRNGIVSTEYHGVQDTSTAYPYTDWILRYS